MREGGGAKSVIKFVIPHFLSFLCVNGITLVESHTFKIFMHWPHVPCHYSVVTFNPLPYSCSFTILFFFSSSQLILLNSQHTKKKTQAVNITKFITHKHTHTYLTHLCEIPSITFGNVFCMEILCEFIFVDCRERHKYLWRTEQNRQTKYHIAQ